MIKSKKIITVVAVVVAVVAVLVTGLYFLLTAHPDSRLGETEQESAVSEYEDLFPDSSDGYTDTSELPDMDSLPSDYDESRYADEFKLAGIDLADSYEAVLQVYGKPLSQKTSSEVSFHNSDYICHWTYWYYDGLVVLFMKVEEKGQQLTEDIGTVFAIQVVSLDYPTRRGIKVGDTVSQVLERYNQEYEGASFSEDTNEMFFEDGLNCLRFSVKDGHVTEIMASQVIN